LKGEGKFFTLEGQAHIHPIDDKNNLQITKNDKEKP
jgi:hypothetical protein